MRLGKKETVMRASERDLMLPKLNMSKLNAEVDIEDYGKSSDFEALGCFG